ncbi:PDZ domain-containing protein [Anatilimnocola sp. NA78]|uniref:PDZ domain-containing protein n=1 Tax=Anatilimnocola sp. NA78 TaxID=3415683 RepID=UPI003CE487EA
MLPVDRQSPPTRLCQPAWFATFLAGAMLLSSGFSAAQETPKAESLATPEQLSLWAKELDHDSFVVREDATHSLIRAGKPAVDVCRKVLQSPNAETGARALHVLHQLALSNDIDVLESARTALEEVTQGKTSPLKVRADEVLAQLNAQKQAITLSELEGLGARIRRSQVFNGVGVDEVISSLEIGTEWRGTESDFRRLRWLADVRQVALVGDRVTDAALPHVANMKGLRSLQAYRANITDEGLKSLAGCAQLEDVGIYYIPVTNESLNVLKGLKALTSVRVYGTRATPEMAAELQVNLGAGKVDFRHGAFLGVGCITVDTNCAISRVHTGSPADKAGVRQDDIVLGFNGEMVPDFETLTALISKLRAGDVAELSLRRVALADDGRPVHKTVAIKVTLGEWDVNQFIMGAIKE